MGKFNFIINGAGAAGLSLLMHLIRSGSFSSCRILLLEKEPKIKNDRTWCFWESSPGLFEEIVFRKWNRLAFYGSEGFSVVHDIRPYDYKLIRGIDFYNYCFETISRHPGITVRYGNVEDCVSDDRGTYVIFDGEKISADFIFNSVLFEAPRLGRKDYYLLQHFKGWHIKTKHAIFNEKLPTLMDFRVDQQEGTGFVYVMPFSADEALVEYTVFSDAVLREAEYDRNLKAYCSDMLQCGDYELLSEEKGIIPMTNYSFERRRNNIINIGTAGGQTKASSGYTFQFIQKHSAAITASLIKTGKPFVPVRITEKRFAFYDSTLLNILSAKAMPGADIFTTLVKQNELRKLLKFLDNETSLPEELKLIRPLPAFLFLKAALIHPLRHAGR